MDDDDAFVGGLFGGDDDDEESPHAESKEEKQEPTKPKKIKDDTCPLPNPAGALVRVLFDGELFPATIKSYEEDSNTYTIVWKSSGVLQYRTKPSDINWDAFVYEEEKKEEKKEEDELWLAARRGSLRSVKRFIESGVHYDETGKSQQRTPFYHAVFCGHTSVVEYLISLGAWDSDDTAFITANAEIRDLLIKTGTGGKPRRNSMKKVEPSQTMEMRRASVVKTAKQNLEMLAGQATSEQLEALKQLEERLLAVEAAMKTEIRRQSVALKKAASAKKVTITDEKAKEDGTGQKQDSTKIISEKSKIKTSSSAKTGPTAIVVAEKRPKSIIFRIFTSILPRRLFRKRQ